MRKSDIRAFQSRWLNKTVFACWFSFFFQKMKPRGQTITKQTFMDAATLEKCSVLMEVCFLLSVFQLPSMCLSRKKLLSAALFPATPCFTFISDITHIYIWVSTAWNWNNKVKSILLMRTSLECLLKKGETLPVYLRRPDFSDSSGLYSTPAFRNQSSVCLTSIK